jgi:glycosyltransferase involved in cell wall biosynthesis
MNTRSPLVSVVLAVHNDGHFLAESVHSVLNQTYDSTEIIVVDDGSTDTSPTVARDFQPRVRYVRQDERGPGAARNVGVSKSGGEFLAFLDADDVWERDKLERQVSALRETPTLHAVFGHVTEFFSPELTPELAARCRPPASYAPGLIPSAMLITRDAWSRVGTFAEALPLGYWIDWYARLQEQRLETVMLSAVVMRRRIHGDNLTLRLRDERVQYVQAVKAALDRRRRA